MTPPIETSVGKHRNDSPRKFGIRGMMIGVTLMSVLFAFMAFAGLEIGLFLSWLVLTIGARSLLGFDIRSTLVCAIGTAGLGFTLLIGLLHRESMLNDLSTKWSKYSPLEFVAIAGGFLLGPVGLLLLEVALRTIKYLDLKLIGPQAPKQRKP